jgi:dynein intermediate chain 2, axonemal
MIFKDPNQVKRAVTKISWHPDATEPRVGVSYAQLRFQQMPPNMPKMSYIWNLNNPNRPERTLDPSSPLCTLVFNHKNADVIVGGAYNGSLQFFDQRKGSSSGVIKPVESTILEKSHHDAIYDVYWLTTSKAGTQCVSTSTDGRLLWWDQRMLAEGPTDELILYDANPVAGQPLPKVCGGTTLEYNSEASPMKYLVGCEQGYIMQANRRKDKVEINVRYGLEDGKHHGPVYALQRNPAQLKYFLSVGDWTAKIWSEELRQPIMQTRYHQSYLTDGCWSPQRCGLFYLTRMDGFLDVWDFFYRQNEVAYSVKVSDAVLTSIQVQGQMASIGDCDGTVHMIQLCRALYDNTLQPKEKEIMQTIFDREFRREKQLELNKRMGEKKAPAKDGAKDKAKDKIAERLEAKLEEITCKFFEQFPEDEENYRRDQAEAKAEATAEAKDELKAAADDEAKA